MKNIKTKEIAVKSIKSLDKTLTLTGKTKKPMIKSYKNIKNSIEEDTTTTDYGERKVFETVERAKNKYVNTNKKIGKGIKNVVKRKIAIHKEKNEAERINEAFSTAKEKSKLSKKALEKGKELAINSTKKTSNFGKRLASSTVNSIKAILSGLKSLIAILIAGGSLALIGIVVICLIAALFSSIFGIFFSSTNVNTVPMSEAIVKINEKMDNKISQIEAMNPHDEVVINSNKAEWKDVLAIYSVKVSNGSQYDVMTLDDNKIKVLEDVFWDMNDVTYELKTENYIPEVIGNLGYKEEPVQEIMQKQVLHINIKGKNVEEMKRAYMFSPVQFKELDELTSEEYDMLWNNAIYGMYYSDGDFTKWRQADSSWGNIKIGSTDKTLGDIGCLITSVAILIEKSNVDTNNIYPFNPGSFTIVLNNNYGFDKNGNLQYSAINKVVPSFKYQGYVKLKDKSKAEKLKLMKEYYDKGYYISVEVKGAIKDNEHWVALDNINNNSVLMIDPASDKADMWDKYDWNNTSGFIYFKII